MYIKFGRLKTEKCSNGTVDKCVFCYSVREDNYQVRKALPSYHRVVFYPVVNHSGGNCDHEDAIKRTYRCTSYLDHLVRCKT